MFACIDAQDNMWSALNPNPNLDLNSTPNHDSQVEINMTAEVVDPPTRLVVHWRDMRPCYSIGSLRSEVHTNHLACASTPAKCTDPRQAPTC